MGTDQDEDDDLERLLHHFGVGLDGKLAFPPQKLADVAGITGGKAPPETTRPPLTGTLGPPSFVKRELLEEAGWGVVFAEGVDDAIKAKLEPLIARRRELANGEEELFKTFTVKPADTIEELQKRWKFSPGIVDPKVVPYYLLLVGDPTQIPFELQHALDVDFAVGRLDLASPAAVEAYVAGVLRAEDAPQRRRNLGVFAPRNPDDGATRESSDNLVAPLVDKLKNKKLPVEPLLGDDATKAALAALLGADAPALVFTAGHGAVAKSGDPQQHALHGALITREWPGPLAAATELKPEWRLAGDDLGDVALDGLIAMFYACYGGGVPAKSQYPYYLGEGVRDLAPAPFTTALPRAMLARGAGAVIAHVERTWDVGFKWKGVEEPQITTILSTLVALVRGARVGDAVGDLNTRYASLSTQFHDRKLVAELQGTKLPPRDAARMWMHAFDARGWFVLGDPAVRIAPKPPGLGG